MNLSKRKTIYLLPVFVLIILAACTKDDSEERQAEHDARMEELKAFYGMTEENNIGDGIYVKYEYDGDLEEAVFPEETDVVICDVLAMTSDQQPYYISDRQTAIDYDELRSDYIYGPLRMWVAYELLGLRKAIVTVPVGSHAIMLLPHDQAYGGYKPIIYITDLYNTIHDIEDYNEQQILNAKDSLSQRNPAEVLPLDGVDDAYSQVIQTGTPHGVDFENRANVTIVLHGYYLETDSTYVEDFPGRMFFPYNNSTDTLQYEFGVKGFPLTDILEEVIPLMNKGEKREVITNYDYGFGTDGFRHPYDGFFIIPPEMPIHYTVELLNVVSVND